MKSVFFKPVITSALSIFIFCFTLPIAYASTSMLGVEANSDVKVITPKGCGWFNQNNIDSKYGPVVFNLTECDDHNPDDVRLFLNNDMKEGRSGAKNYVVKAQKYEGNTLTDLILNNKKEADDFCGDLQKLTLEMYGYDSTSAPLSSSSIYVGVDVSYVIAVAYKIAYNQGIENPRKYVFCRNPWGWEPASEYPDENPKTGIAKSGLKQAPDLQYHLTCVDPRKLAPNFRPKMIGAGDGSLAWFWEGESQGYPLSSNNDALVDFDRDIGSKFCDENISGIKTSVVKDNKYYVTCNDPKKQNPVFHAEANAPYAITWDGGTVYYLPSTSNDFSLANLNQYVGTPFCE